MKLLAIDPGNVESALLEYDLDTGLPVWWAKLPNRQALKHIDGARCGLMACENIASYGMAVGAEIFSTCIWIGRFVERWEALGWPDATLVYRRTVKLHLCGSARAKDTNVRQALLDRYGPGKALAVGLKASPGPLYGMAGDCWSALAVAVTVADTRPERALELAA